MKKVLDFPDIIKFALHCIDKIEDPGLRDMLRAALGGATTGASIGWLVGQVKGPEGAVIGASFGALVGSSLAVAWVLWRRFRQIRPSPGPEFLPSR